MVGTDGEGMEETDGGVLNLVAVCCCLLVACQHRCASLSPCRGTSWPCCCCPVLLSLCRVVVIGLFWSCPVSQRGGLGEGGTGGTYLASTRMNDECRSSFWLPHRCWQRGTCIPHVVVSIRGWSFAFVAGRSCLSPTCSDQQGHFSDQCLSVLAFVLPQSNWLERGSAMAHSDLFSTDQSAQH